MKLVRQKLALPTPFHLTFMLTVTPLGGVFNVLIYTKPMVRSLRRMHPEYSRTRALYLVIRAGGIVPADDIDDSKLRGIPNDVKHHDIESIVSIKQFGVAAIKGKIGKRQKGGDPYSDNAIVGTSGSYLFAS